MNFFLKKRKIFFILLFAVAAVVICVLFLNSAPVQPDEGKSEVHYKINYIKTFGIDEAKNIEEEPYEFASIYSLDCDEDGNIYVLDGKLDCVKKFTRDGKYVKSFFCRGKGPDEISNAYRLKIDSGQMLILNEYGYEIKTFDLEGKFLKTYRLPEQFLYDVDIWYSNNRKHLVYSAFDQNNNGKAYNNFKMLNLDDLKIETVFSPTKTPYSLNIQQRLTIEKNKGILWTANTEQIKLEAYDLKNRGEILKRISIPGDFKRNKILFCSKDGRNGIFQAVYYNLVQPFILKDDLFFILTENQVEADTIEAAVYPSKTCLTLYHVENEKPKKIQTLKENEQMRVGATFKDRVILYGFNPYPRFQILEITPEEMKSSVNPVGFDPVNTGEPISSAR